VIVFAAAGLFGWEEYSRREEARPKVQQTFWDIAVGMKGEEVIFRKGQPAEKEDDVWTYYEPKSKIYYFVGFRGGAVRWIRAQAHEDDVANLPTIQGISAFSSSEDVEAKFGRPEVVDESEDHERRLFNYTRFGVFFGLERNHVRTVGVFDPKMDPIRFEKAGNKDEKKPVK